MLCPEQRIKYILVTYTKYVGIHVSENINCNSPSVDVAADERAARLKAEQFQQALNDSANEAETSSVSTSSDGRDSRTGGDFKTSKRLEICPIYKISENYQTDISWH